MGDKIRQDALNNTIKEKLPDQKCDDKFFNKSWDTYLYTICLIVIGFNYALDATLFAPALVDFKYIFHTSMNNVSFTNFFRNLGYLIGCFAGFFYGYINRQFAIIIMVIILGIFTAILPFCSSLWQIYLCTTLYMIGGGGFDCALGPWLVEMWGQNSAPILQLAKAANGFGTIVAPLLDEPFLVGELSVNNLTQFNHSQIEISKVNEELNYSIDRRSKLKTPFLVGAGLTLTIPAILLVMFFIRRYRPPKTDKSQVNDKIVKIPELSQRVKYFLIALIAMSLSTFGGMEMAHFSYSSAYYQDLPIHLSAQKAAEIMSVFSATLTVGKLISAFISIKVKAEIIITYHLVILGISLVGLYFGSNSELMIWIGNAIIGFGFSAVWTSYFSFAEDYFGLTNNVSSIFLSVSSLCPMITPFVCGPLIEKDPQIFLLIQLVYFILTVVLFIMMMFTVKMSTRSSKINNTYSLN